MQTALQAAQSARTQYRAAFREMAASDRGYSLYQGITGIALLQNSLGGARRCVVRNVHCMSEQTMVNALTAAVQRDPTLLHVL